ncbi:FtsX-like permease family protein [Streptomyces sp. NPDC047515]|uniref:ABC transporter permease n=1 Tax=Streptomyces sp. NPDC047515 TaxID=3155380 RepID=UPI0033F34EE9
MLRTALRNALAHKARLAMTVLAVCLGVAFVSGTLVFADSSAAAFRAAASHNFSDIVLTVKPKDPPPGTAVTAHDGVLDDTLVAKLAALPGVADARPTADGSAVMNGSDGTPLRAGSAWAHPADAYVPGKDGKDRRYPVVEGRGPRTADEVAVDTGTAAAGHFTVGDRITLATDGPVMVKKLVGLVSTTDPRVLAGGTLAVFDKATAFRLFATPGHYSAIDLYAEPGTDQAALDQRVTALLPADRAETSSGAAQAAQQAMSIDMMTRGHQKMPKIFAVVALFIGSFLVVNTFTMLVSRRTREIALLRAIGASRRQVARSVLLEAVLTGLVASAAGFVLGLGVAAALPGILAATGDPLPSGPLVVGPLPVLAALAVGVGVTVLAAWLPARRAAKVAPVEAMRAVDQKPSATRSRLRGLAGLALVVAGGAVMLSLRGAKDASDANLNTALLGGAVFVVGLLLAAPVLAGPVIRLLGRPLGRFGLAGRLARENALRDPRRTAATAATLMLSTAMVAGLAVLGNSSAQAIDARTAAGLGANYVISTPSVMQGIDQAAARRVDDTPGVRTTTAVSDATIILGGATAKGIAGVDPATVGDTMKLDFTSGSLAGIGPGRIALSATLAREQHLTTGDTIEATIGRVQEPRTFTVAGVYQDNPTTGDLLGARSEVQQDSWNPGSVQRLLVRTDDGATSPALERRLRSAVGDNPLLKVRDRAALVREGAGTMSSLLTLMYGVLALGVVITALGIVNTLAMSVAERTREIGVLRAIGADRATVRTTIRLESLTVAAFGTLLGLAGGVFGAWAVGPLAGGAMSGYTTSLPWGTLLLVVAVSLTIGVFAAALPARRAASLSPLEAVAQG